MQTENENSRILSFLIWLSITMFYCYQLVLRMLPNIINQDIMAEFNVGAAEFASFAGLYYIGYILLHIPIGLALTKIGARKVLPICIALTALGLVPLVYPLGWNGAVLGRIITGIGSSAASVGALQIFRIIYPAKFSRMLGLMVSLGLITAVYAGAPLARFILNIGASSAMNILLYLGILLAVFTYFLMPKSTEEVSESNIMSDVKAVLFNYKLLFTSLFAGLMIGPIEGFADAWASTFLMGVYGIEKISADSMALSVFLGMSIGCIILPYITDKTGYYFGVTIASGVGIIICFSYMLSGKANINSLDYICIIIGIFSAYQVIILAKVATFVSEERSGIAGAVANMIMMTFGWFFHSMIGTTLDNSWDGTVASGARQYSSEAFIQSISIIPSSALVAVIGLSAVAMGIYFKGKGRS
jgi:predicted MFS family arabinose efflux permease